MVPVNESAATSKNPNLFILFPAEYCPVDTLGLCRGGLVGYTKITSLFSQSHKALPNSM